MRYSIRLLFLFILLSVIVILAGCFSDSSTASMTASPAESNVEEANTQHQSELGNTIKINTIGDNMLGEIVKIRGFITKIKRFDSGHASALITDGSDSITLYFHKDSKTDLDMLITDHEYLVTGVVNSYKGELQVQPQRPQDVRLTQPIELEEAQVIKVVDGDSIHVENSEGKIETIRMIGVDTPELARGGKAAEFYAKQAQEYAETLLLNKTVYLEKDYDDLDQYERKLRYVWLIQPETIDETTIKTELYSALLLAEGYAQFVHYNDDRKYKELLTEIESEAKAKGVGIWQ